MMKIVSFPNNMQCSHFGYINMNNVGSYHSMHHSNFFLPIAMITICGP